MKIHQKRNSVAVGVVALILPLALLLFMNSRTVPVTWRFEPSLNGIVRELTRRDLVGTIATSGKVRGMYLNSIKPSELIEKLPKVASLYSSYFGVTSILLFLIGLVSVRKIDTTLKKTMWLLVLCTTVLIPLYVPWPDDLSGQSITVRLYLLGFICMPLFISLGIRTLLLHKYVINKSNLVMGILSLLAIYQLQKTYVEANLRDFTINNKLYMSILQQIPQNSLVTCMGDVSCFALLYLHTVEGLRSDLILLPHQYVLVRDSVLKAPNLHGFNYPGNPDLLIDYIAWNLGKRPIAVVGLQKTYSDLLGLEYGFIKYQPQGYFGMIGTTAQTQTVADYTLSESLASIRVPKYDHMRLQIKAALAQAHSLNAMTENRIGTDPFVIYDRELKYAEMLVQDLPEIYQAGVDSTKKYVAQYHGYKEYLGDQKQATPSELESAADSYYTSGEMDKALIGYRMLLLLDPKNDRVRLKLGKTYQAMGDEARYRIETKNVTQSLHD